MARTKTSNKQKKSVGATKNWNVSKLAKCEAWSPTKEILDSKNLAKAIAECLLNNDPEGVVEVIEIYLRTVDRVKFSKRAHISRSTLYHSLKERNPTIKTVAKIVHAAAA